MSPESPAVGREGVFVYNDAVVDDGIGVHVFIFPFKLAIEPAGEITQRLDHGVPGAGGHVLTGRAVALDGDLHAVFVTVRAAMADVCAELVKVPTLDRLKSIGDAVKFRILRRVSV